MNMAYLPVRFAVKCCIHTIMSDLPASIAGKWAKYICRRGTSKGLSHKSWLNDLCDSPFHVIHLRVDSQSATLSASSSLMPLMAGMRLPPLWMTEMICSFVSWAPIFWRLDSGPIMPCSSVPWHCMQRCLNTATASSGPSSLEADVPPHAVMIKAYVLTVRMMASLRTNNLDLSK